MTCTIRDATTPDLARVTALYGREVRNGTATFELEPPSLEAMTKRFDAVKQHDLPWLVAEVDGVFAGYAYASPFRPRPAYRYGVEGGPPPDARSSCISVTSSQRSNFQPTCR